MTDLEILEASVEQTRLNYDKALATNSPDTVSLFRMYWELLRDFNRTLITNPQGRLNVSNRGPKNAQEHDGVLIQVLNDELNVEGLMLKYFVDRAMEAGRTSGITEDDLWQIVASDNYPKARWVSELTPLEVVAQINTSLERGKLTHGMSVPAETVTPLSPEEHPVDNDPRPESPKKGGKRNIENEIAEIFIKKLEEGVAPWHQPWAATGGRLPISMSTDKPYQGTNAMLLGVSAMDQGYTSPYWGTFNQIKELGGAINKGEHGTMVVFYKPIIREEANEVGEMTTERRGAIMKAFTVFNAAQTTGLPEKYLTIENSELNEFERIEHAESVVAEYLKNNGPTLIHGSDRAAYSPSMDRIVMPNLGAFETREKYYSTLFHELGHSTGHGSRLSREGVVEGHRFGDEYYSREELIAEMTSAMSCAYLGLDQSETVPNSAAYLASWIEVIKEEPSILMKAAAGAQKACDTIGVSHFLEHTVEVEPELRAAVGDPMHGEPPGTEGPSLEEREASVRKLQRYVRLAASEEPGALAEGELTDEMCQLHSEQNSMVAEGRDTAEIDKALAICQRKLDILTGRTLDLTAFTHLCSAARAAHADDVAKLCEEETALAEARKLQDELTPTVELSPSASIGHGPSR